MIELVQQNQDYVTQKELETYLSDYDKNIQKAFHTFSGGEKFYQYLKKSREIIEEKLKEIPSFQLTVNEIIPGTRMDFILSDDYSRFYNHLEKKFNHEKYASSDIKTQYLRGDVNIYRWVKKDVEKIKYTVIFEDLKIEENSFLKNIYKDETLKDLSNFTLANHWVPWIKFYIYLDYMPTDFKSGDTIIINNNIFWQAYFHKKYWNIIGKFYFNICEVVLLNNNMNQIPNSETSSKSRYNLNSLKKILLSSILVFGLYYAMEYFGYGFSYFQNAKNNANHEMELTKRNNEIITKKREEQQKIDIENFKNGDPIYGNSHYIKVFSGKYPNGSMSRLSKVDISGLSKSELDVMQNEIYARHGLIFKSKNINTYFTKQEWYKPKFHNVNNFLSEVEKENLEYIENIKSKLSN
jgi:hypothetical protein